MANITQYMSLFTISFIELNCHTKQKSGDLYGKCSNAL